MVFTVHTFSWGKAAGPWSWSFTSHLMPRLRMIRPLPICFHCDREKFTFNFSFSVHCVLILRLIASVLFTQVSRNSGKSCSIKLQLLMTVLDFVLFLLKHVSSLNAIKTSSASLVSESTWSNWNDLILPSLRLLQANIYSRVFKQSDLIWKGSWNNFVYTPQTHSDVCRDLWGSSLWKVLITQFGYCVRSWGCSGGCLDSVAHLNSEQMEPRDRSVWKPTTSVLERVCLSEWHEEIRKRLPLQFRQIML
jgi:hypothetical protein